MGDDERRTPETTSPKDTDNRTSRFQLFKASEYLRAIGSSLARTNSAIERLNESLDRIEKSQTGIERSQKFPEQDITQQQRSHDKEWDIDLER